VRQPRNAAPSSLSTAERRGPTKTSYHSIVYEVHLCVTALGESDSGVVFFWIGFGVLQVSIRNRSKSTGSMRRNGMT